MRRSILLVDDDPEVRSVLSRFFERRDWGVFHAENARTGVEAYERERPDLVLLDLNLPGGLDGLKVLEILRQRDEDAVVILLTGHGDIETAVEAMRLGAENFLTKPVEFPHLEAVAERAFEKADLRRRNRFYQERQTEAPGLDGLGGSPAMREIARKVERLASSDASVLLLGESGTGKGWLSQTIHTLSPRADQPFVEVNCAGLSTTFLDSELFGHEKGAFTDAKTQKRGLFEVADGGTLFLDEIGDLAPDLQPKLLKVLESRKFRRLGGTREIEVDVRLVAATNQDLEKAVESGAFREDLYYRLAVFPLELPPIRERGRDAIVDLTLGLLSDLRGKLGRGPDGVSRDAMKLIAGYGWPGNIRELRNVLERVILLTDAPEIEPRHLPPELRNGAEAGAAHDPTLSLEEIERSHIARALRHHEGNRSATARSLGISRATLYDKLHRYELEDVGR